MKKIFWMGLGGVLLLGASGLLLKNRGHVPSAHAGHHHPHSRAMAVLLQKQQEVSGASNGESAQGRLKKVQLDETGEPPLATPLAPSPIQPVLFQPVPEGPTLLPLLPVAPVRDEKKSIPVVKEASKEASKEGGFLDGLFGSLWKDSGEKTGKAPEGGAKGKNKITLGIGFNSQMGPFFNVEMDVANQKKNESAVPPGKDLKLIPIQNNDGKPASLAPAGVDSPSQNKGRVYTVRFEEENLQFIARKTLGDASRWGDIAKLNPALKADGILNRGTAIQLPADALLEGEDPARVQPLPGARPKTPPEAAKIILPLTGTYPCLLDGKRLLTLPPVVLQQLGQPDQLLLSPGPDVCLWLTGAAHLEKLSDRLEQSSAAEKEVRVFRRLFFGQIEKLQVVQGKLVIPERLALFAQLEKEIALVGVEDHFEIWDLVKWREYTQKQAQQEKK